MLSVAPKLYEPLKIVALGDSLVYGYGDPEKAVGWNNCDGGGCCQIVLVMYFII
jgi:lysophospholipase L1-like esterase